MAEVSAMNFYAPLWEDGFERSLIRMGLTLQMFENLGGKRGVSTLLETDPFEPKSTFEISGTDHRYLWTRIPFPDLPAMLIAYSVDPLTREIRVKGAEAVWEEDLADV